MGKLLHPAFYNGCNYSSILKFKLIHFSKIRLRSDNIIESYQFGNSLWYTIWGENCLHYGIICLPGTSSAMNHQAKRHILYFSVKECLSTCIQPITTLRLYKMPNILQTKFTVSCSCKKGKMFWLLLHKISWKDSFKKTSPLTEPISVTHRSVLIF